MQAWKQLPSSQMSRDPSKDEDYMEETRHKASAYSKGAGEISNQDTTGSNFKVVIRGRPPLEREISPHTPFQGSVRPLINNLVDASIG